MLRTASLSIALLLACTVAFAADTPTAPAAQTKTGTVKSVDAAAKTFVMQRDPRPLTFTVTDKTVITLDGAASTFDAALKEGLKVEVTYTTSGQDRTASKVAVTSAEKK